MLEHSTASGHEGCLHGGVSGGQARGGIPPTRTLSFPSAVRVGAFPSVASLLAAATVSERRRGEARERRASCGWHGLLTEVGGRGTVVHECVDVRRGATAAGGKAAAALPAAGCARHADATASGGARRRVDASDGSVRPRGRHTAVADRRHMSRVETGMVLMSIEDEWFAAFTQLAGAAGTAHTITMYYTVLLDFLLAGDQPLLLPVVGHRSLPGSPTTAVPPLAVQARDPSAMSIQANNCSGTACTTRWSGHGERTHTLARRFLPQRLPLQKGQNATGAGDRSCSRRGP